jgi:hypothetical protein
MVLKFLNGTCKTPNDVDIGGLSGEDGGERCVGRFAVEA